MNKSTMQTLNSAQNIALKIIFTCQAHIPSPYTEREQQSQLEPKQK